MNFKKKVIKIFIHGFLHLLGYDHIKEKDFINMFKEVKPFTFFNFIAMVFMISGLILGYPLIIRWMETGTVPRIPTAIIVMGLIVLSSICVTCGLVLDCVAKGRKEAKRLSYLIFPVTPKEDS